MAPSQIIEPVTVGEKMSPTQENKPPIPAGTGAKKAMEAYFAGNNHMEFRRLLSNSWIQRSSSSSARTTRTFSRGATPSRETGVPEGAVDPEVLKNALKKIPSVEKIALRPTPPRSRSISRCRSPLPDEELLDEKLPDFYKLTLKPTERTGSQTRDILLSGDRLSRGATPTKSGDVPEFRRVALRRTPSREQLADEDVHKRSTLRKNVVEGSSLTNLSRSTSYSSLTAINKTVLSRRNSIVEENKPEFKGVVLKKTGSRPGSRSGSPTKTGSHTELSEGASSLKKVEFSASSRSASRRSSASSETTAEFANVTLKKAAAVKGDQSKFQVEQVSLKPIPVGEGEEEDLKKASSSSEGWRADLVRKRQERSRESSATRQRVQRETKFEANDEEYLDIKSSLEKLKKKEATPVAAEAPKKEAKHAAEDGAEKPRISRCPKTPATLEAEVEKVHLKPVVRKVAEKEQEESESVQLRSVPKNVEKRASFTSSTESVKKEVAEEDQKMRVPIERKLSFTSLENISNAGCEEKKAKNEAMNKTSPTDDAAAKPLLYRRSKKPTTEVEEAEKVHLKPVVRKAAEEQSEAEKVQLRHVAKNNEKRMSFSSSIECIKKAVDEEEEVREKRAPLMRKMSFTSSLENIAIGGEEREKVHLSCFSREMGSNVDLVQVCQDQGEGKHEVKLEFEIGGNQAKEEVATEMEVKTQEEVTSEITETIEERLNASITVDGETGEKISAEEDEEEEEEEEEIREEVVTLTKLTKAPSIDGLFQRQEVQAAFTFTLPFQNEQQPTKLSLEIPNLS